MLHELFIHNSSSYAHGERQSYEQKLLKILEEKMFMDFRTER